MSSKGAAKYETYWRGQIAQEIADIPLPHTDRRGVLLGYAMALSDATNTALKWKDAGNYIEPLDDGELPEPISLYPRWPERTED